MQYATQQERQGTRVVREYIAVANHCQSGILPVENMTKCSNTFLYMLPYLITHCHILPIENITISGNTLSYITTGDHYQVS